MAGALSGPPAPGHPVDPLAALAQRPAQPPSRRSLPAAAGRLGDEAGERDGRCTMEARDSKIPLMAKIHVKPVGRFVPLLIVGLSVSLLPAWLVGCLANGSPLTTQPIRPPGKSSDSKLKGLRPFQLLQDFDHQQQVCLVFLSNSSETSVLHFIICYHHVYGSLTCVVPIIFLERT